MISPASDMNFPFFECAAHAQRVRDQVPPPPVCGASLDRVTTWCCPPQRGLGRSASHVCAAWPLFGNLGGLPIEYPHVGEAYYPHARW